MVEDVTLGSRQIRLRQQFRFDLASTPPSVSVYSSVRSGWSPVLFSVIRLLNTARLPRPNGAAGVLGRRKLIKTLFYKDLLPYVF